MSFYLHLIGFLIKIKIFIYLMFKINTLFIFISKIMLLKNIFISEKY